MPQFDALRALQLCSHVVGHTFHYYYWQHQRRSSGGVAKQGAADYLLKDRLVRLGQAVMHAATEKLHDEKRQAESALQESEERSKTSRQRPRHSTAIGLPALEALNMLALQQRLSPATTRRVLCRSQLGFKISHVDDRRRVLQQSIAGRTDPADCSALIRKDGNYLDRTNLPSTTTGLIAIEGLP